MRFERIRYLEWARQRFEESPPKYNLALSGMAPATAEEAGIDMAALPLAGRNAYGYPALRRSLGALYSVDPKRVMPATGTTLANFLIQAALVRDGDTVLCEWPAYEPLWRSFSALGARVSFFQRDPVRHYLPDIAAIHDGLAQGARLCVLSDLHNPTAALVDRDALREIGSLARRFDAWVLVDEVYLSSVFDRSVDSALRLDERFIITASLTKTFGLGGLRAGWAIAPADVVSRGNDIFAHLGGNAPILAEEASVQALAHLPQLRERAARRRMENWPHVRAFAQERGLLDTEPDGAFIVWLRLPQRMSADRLVDHLLEKYETLVVPGSFFGVGDRVRLGYSGDHAIVVEGLRRLGAALTDLRNGG